MSQADRRQEIAANLAVVDERIRVACSEVGRSPEEVRLIVVTKFFPAGDVRLLAELGVTDVGENRHQEAEAKAAECADLDLTWHFIGGLQSNKAAAVAAYSDVVHSVDRRKLIGPLDRGAGTRTGACSTCCSRSASTRPELVIATARTPMSSTTWQSW